MDKRSILITGCSSGIGYCVARGLRERGYRVFATARKHSDVERLTAEGLESLPLDLDDSASIAAAMAEILERTGNRLDAVFHNGALLQDHFALWGPTNWLKFDEYQPHADAMPISLQDHGDPVGFRNIWLRKLPELPTYTGLGEETANVTISDAQLDRYTGDYLIGERTAYEVTKQDGALQLTHWGRKFDLVPKSETKFLFKRTDADVEFELDDDGIARKITVTITGSAGHATKR